MGVVSTLQDIRRDLEVRAPADILKELDWCIDRLCEWERSDRHNNLDYTQPAARDCWTCRHRRQYKVGTPHIRVQTCGKFHRSCGRRTATLPCGYAYDVLCGGGDYEPDFWARVLKALCIT